jgi:hypothetical protein
MTSRGGKARIPSQAGDPLVFSEDQWALIEKAYGRSLSPEIRVHIIIATNALRLVSAAEQRAPSLDKIRIKTKKLKNDAKSLLREAGLLINENDVWASFEVLADTLNTVVKECSNEHLQFLLVVNSMHSACDLMLRNWESDGGLHAGRMWDAWVQSINKLMQYNGLPSTVRTDSRDADNVNSEFVWMIKELQKHIPKELRRHDHSADAVAKAIQRARKSNWWLKLIPPNIREKFALDLESPDERANRCASFQQMLRTLPGWVEVSPGRFERVEMVELMKRD